MPFASTEYLTDDKGIPHCTSEDDIYDGYFIPKGSIVFSNIWYVLFASGPASKLQISLVFNRAVLQDPKTFPNPGHFDPERFLTSSGTLNPDVKNPGDIVFGFGRRCVRSLVAKPTPRL
jgi:cytochrome P450